MIIIGRIHLNILTTKLSVKENFCVFSSIPLQGFISKQLLEKYTQKQFWLKSMDLNSFALLGDCTYQNTALMNSCRSRKEGKGFRATACSSSPARFWGDTTQSRIFCSGDGAKPLPCEISLFNENLLREEHRQYISRVTHMHKTQKSIVKSLFDEGFLPIKRSSRGSDCYSALRRRSPAAAPAREMCRPAHFPETCFLSRQRPLPPPRHPVSSLSSADELIAFFLCILWRCPTAYSGSLRVSERARPPQARHGSARLGARGEAGRQGRAGREGGWGAPAAVPARAAPFPPGRPVPVPPVPVPPEPPPRRAGGGRPWGELSGPHVSSRIT